MCTIYTHYECEKDVFVNKRLNITLPETTIALMDQLAPKGARSQLIDEAVNFYVKQKGKKTLQERLATGAKARSQRDQGLAAEWFFIDTLR